MSTQNSSSPEEVKGCLALCFLIVLVVAIPTLITFLKFLLIVAAIGAIGFLGYKLYLYDQRTGNITTLVEDRLNLPRSRKDQILLPGENQNLLEPSDNLQQYTEFEEIKGELQDLKKDYQELQSSNQQIVKDTIENYGEIIDKKNKKDILNDIFGNSTSDYAQSDEFELRQFQEQKKKKQDELDFRELKQDVNEQLFKQKKETHDFRLEAKADNMQLRQDMESGFAYLEKEIYTLKGFVQEKFAHLDARITKEIANVKELISNLRVELKQEISDFKVQVGREFVNVHKQMQMMVGKLEQYEARMEKFTYQVRQIRLDAERRELRGERILNQAQTVYNNHMAQLKVASKDMDMTLKNIAMQNEGFSNRVTQAKLNMDRAAQDQFYALKEIGLERLGVNMLRQDFQQRNEMAQSKMQRLIQEKKHLEEKMRLNLNNHRQVASLQHQLFVNREKLEYSKNRANLMQREFSLINRLSKQ